MFGRGIPVPNFFTTCQQLIVQSVDLARLIGRDILQMQRSQLILGWLIIATIVNRPWSTVKSRGVLCVSCERGGCTERNGPDRQQCVNENSAT